MRSSRCVRARMPAFAVAAVVVLASCSSDEAATTVTTTVTTTAPTTTAVPSTTAAPTTVATTTTLAPTTTVDPLDDITAAIQEARLGAEDAYFAAASDPANQELRDELASYFAPDSLVDRLAFLDELVQNDQRLVANANQPSSVRFLSDVELPDGVESSEAFATTCRVDSDVIVQMVTGSDETVVIDDRIITTLTRIKMTRIDDKWLLDLGELVNTWEGVNSCDG